MDGPARREPGAADSRPEFATLTLDRRRFLVLLGGAAAYAALHSHAGWAKALAGAPALQPWSLPDAAPGAAIETARGLIGAAILAPSHWNSQPWRFEVDGDELRLTLDPQRAMPFADPDQRFAQLSLGAALENLLIAARAWGLQPTVNYLPYGAAARAAAPLVIASVRWQGAEARRDRVLFGAIAERRSNPRIYDGRAITMPNRAQLSAQVSEDVRLHWLDDHRALDRIARRLADATLAQAADTRAQAERFAWTRASDDEARRHGDGMTADALGLGGPLSGFALRALDPRSHFHHWGVESVARDVHDAVRSSGAVALLTVPKRADASAILAGQTYERLALKATTLGIAQQAFSAPIASAKHRDLLAREFGVAGEEPMLLVRFGHAKTPAAMPRRAVALVSTYRAS